MSREEYLKQLAYLLQDIPDDEREEALHYYEEYFEDAGESETEQVIATLGSPERVAAMVRDGLREGSGENGEYTDSGYQNDWFREFNKVPEPRMNFNEEHQQRREYHEGYRQYHQKKERNWILIAVIAVLTFPIWIGVVGAAAGVLIGILGVIFALALTFIGLMLAAWITGIALGAVGIAKLVVAPFLGLLMIGFACICVAIGLLMVLAAKWFLFTAAPGFVRGIVNLGSRMFHRRGQMA